MPASSPPRPTCFVAMPFGRKAPPGKEAPLVDFDRIHGTIEAAVEEAGLECVRADFETTGGFIHKPMYERLLLAEYVVADLTFGNANVAYEVGIRHGAASGATVLICEEGAIASIGFDFKPLRILPYRLQADGMFADPDARAFSSGLTARLCEAGKANYPVDNPLLQITGWTPHQHMAHSKTDVFLARLEYASNVGREVADALRDGGKTALDRLRAIENACFPQSGPVVAQLHTALMALFIGYREVGGYEDMVRLFDRMPKELQRQAVAREQLALALNRIAEERASTGDADGAATARRRALSALDAIPEMDRTAETFGIRGRIHKGWADAEQRAGKATQADGQLKRAIAVYEEGFRFDPRDYYPGVNAITLRLRRGTPEDLAQVAKLVPVVRFAVDRAPTARSESERYWQQATKLELAAAAKDWDGARESLADVLGLGAADWMWATTMNNLRILKDAFAADAEAVANLDRMIASLPSPSRPS